MVRIKAMKIWNCRLLISGGFLKALSIYTPWMNQTKQIVCYAFSLCSHGCSRVVVLTSGDIQRAVNTTIKPIIMAALANYLFHSSLRSELAPTQVQTIGCLLPNCTQLISQPWSVPPLAWLCYAGCLASISSSCNVFDKISQYRIVFRMLNLLSHTYILRTVLWWFVTSTLWYVS